MQESIVFLVRVQRRRKESSRSLSHLLMSFLSDINMVLTLRSSSSSCSVLYYAHNASNALEYAIFQTKDVK